MAWRYRLKGERRLLISVLSAIVALCLMGVAAFAAFGTSPHLDRSKNPGGCASCHRGHGKRGTPMLATVKSEICFACHGISSSLEKVRTKHDMYSVFNKRYRHPVIETGKHHRPTEELPEKSPGTPRHVACQDCHKVHEVTPEKPLAGIRGYSMSRTRVAEARKEYEICYNCHSDSANLPPASPNVREQFSRNNLSYHPVEAAGKNRKVPSLIRSLNIISTIDCSDCHGNDDPFGPQGPHGSNYPAMLRSEYIKAETAETRKTYELCYACHERRSILENESFKKHKEHVVYYHIPCSACHTPHGTDRNPHLIEFSRKFVGFAPLPTYMPSLDGRPTCLLKCHVSGRDALHNNSFYSAKRWP